MHPIIYTERTVCQDCFKCIRECPVKAIKVENACAAIMPESCVLCGHCVHACPNGAKYIRADLSHVRRLFKYKEQVIASLAPSFVSEFPGLPASAIIRALKMLGFHGVSETALGAERVSGSIATLLQDRTPRLLISTACPVIVSYVRKYRPEYAKCLAPFVSPLIAHCEMLHEIYGPSIGVVFVGPCIAKKEEADRNPQLLDYALTFEDLRRWLKDEKIALEELGDVDDEDFVPRPAREGALYPIDGGMIAGVKAGCRVMEADCMSFSGMDDIKRALAGLAEVQLGHPLFLELLACDGGCINGPKAAKRDATVWKRCKVIDYSSYVQSRIPPALSAPPLGGLEPSPISAPVVYSEKILREALKTIGKFSLEDELNCGGCGYDCCRDLAKALVDGKAEKDMCVSYMRKLAQKKANALMEKMPNAIVLVNEELKIIECNYNFAKILGPEMEDAFTEQAGLEGFMLADIAPFHSLFRTVLEKGEDIFDRDLRYMTSIFHVNIFSIEKNQVVCGIFQDITKPTIRKEAMIDKAQAVIKKNLATVQQIAYLLGENAAESEVILNSIINSINMDEPQ